MVIDLKWTMFSKMAIKSLFFSDIKVSMLTCFTYDITVPFRKLPEHFII